MKRTITLSVVVEDGETVMLVAVLEPGLVLSVAKKGDRGQFGRALDTAIGGPRGDRSVDVVIGEPREDPPVDVGEPVE